MTDPRDHALDRDDLLDDPLELFAAWFAAARDAGIPGPEAMALATADGAPSVRMVLLKAFDERGFVLTTNLESRKARELALARGVRLVERGAVGDRLALL